MILLGCATEYKGSGPNFSSQGQEAETEIKKYTISDSWFRNGTRVREMGPEGNSYWFTSLQPMMTQVSPKSGPIITKGFFWESIGILMAGYAVGLMQAANNNDSISSIREPMVYATAGVIGAGLYSNYILREAVQQYNHDLKQKFSPQISFKFDF